MPYPYEEMAGPSSKIDQPNPASTNAIVWPFDDESFSVGFDSYDNLDMSRWDILTSAGAKLLVGEEKQEDGSMVYQLYAGDDVDSDEITRRATSELLHFYNLKRLTNGDVDKFQSLIRKARQEFELIGILRRPDFLKADSSVASVIKRLPKDMVASIGYYDIKDFVAGYIPSLEDWEFSKLYYDYKYFLAECGWITSKIDSILGLERLKKDLDRRFHPIPFQKISHEFMDYIRHLGLHQFRGKVEEGKTAYKKRILEDLELERLLFEKRRISIPRKFNEPIHFLVFKEREENYTIQDPAVEVAKIRAFFHDLHPLEKGAAEEESSKRRRIKRKDLLESYDRISPF